MRLSDIQQFLRGLLGASYQKGDPGDGEALVFTHQFQIIELRTAGPETRTLPDPTEAGIDGTLVFHTDGGDCVVTAASGVDVAGNTTFTFDTAGQWAKFRSIETSAGLRWRCVGYDGVSGIQLAPDFAAGSLERADLAAETKSYPLRLTDGKVWNAPATSLPAAAANDDLGIIYNTFLTGAPTLETIDLKAAGETAIYGYYEFAVPPEYVDGQAITLRANAGMKTTIADAAATLDIEAVRAADPDTDLCATDAADINSLTAADKDFTLTPTNVVAGDLLQIRVAVTVTDAATGTAVIGQVNSLALRLAVKG